MPADATPPMAMPSMMAGPLGVPMTRQGSGTSWIPEAVALPARHFMVGAWEVMAHGNVFGQAIFHPGNRAENQVGSINWSMVMATRRLLGGQLQLRAMNSVEAATVGRCGYPHALQTGETCHGAPNADRQHPHDFFMEMAALYEREFTPQLAWSVYLAPSGEPALGPVAFMHRSSAMNDPLSNITHHWQDASHIMFGVATAALYGRQWKVEGSAFNGREPDEHRWNFDLNGRPWDSYAGRVTVNRDSSWSFSGSFGRIVGMEPDEPTEVTQRATGSVLYARRMNDRHLATAAIWGANRHDGEWEHSLLGEADLRLSARTSVFGRAEWVRKSDGDLRIAAPGGGTGDHHGHGVTSLGLGVVREIARVGVLDFGLGARASLNLVDETVGAAYGTRTPVGLTLFLRARPRPMTDAEMAAMHARMGHAGMRM